jgi:hypothetical protein
VGGDAIGIHAVAADAVAGDHVGVARRDRGDGVVGLDQLGPPVSVGETASGVDNSAGASGANRAVSSAWIAALPISTSSAPGESATAQPSNGSTGRCQT